MNPNILHWYETNDDKPEVGKLVLGRITQLCYGGDSYSYELLRMDEQQRWYHQDYMHPLGAPEEWAYLVTKVE